jgi:hypothetical protein
MRLIGLAITLAFSLALTPLTGEGQQAGKPYRIGILSGGSPDKNSPHIEAFREGLRDMGWVLIAKLPRPEVKTLLDRAHWIHRIALRRASTTPTRHFGRRSPARGPSEFLTTRPLSEALLQGFHTVRHARGLGQIRGRELSAFGFGLDDLLQRVRIGVVVLGRIPIPRQGLHELVSQLHADPLMHAPNSDHRDRGTRRYWRTLRATFSSLFLLPRKLGTKRGENLINSSFTVPDAKRDEARRNRGNKQKRAQMFAIEPNVHEFPTVAFGEPLQSLRCIGGDADGRSIVAACSLDSH